jgi:hypothetical protein
VAFEGELGVGPGPTREFFEAVAADMVRPEHLLWEPTPDGRFVTLSPDHATDAPGGTPGADSLLRYDVPTERSLAGAIAAS